MNQKIITHAVIVGMSLITIGCRFKQDPVALLKDVMVKKDEENKNLKESLDSIKRKNAEDAEMTRREEFDKKKAELDQREREMKAREVAVKEKEESSNKEEEGLKTQKMSLQEKEELLETREGILKETLRGLTEKVEKEMEKLKTDKQTSLDKIETEEDKKISKMENDLEIMFSGTTEEKDRKKKKSIEIFNVKEAKKELLTKKKNEFNTKIEWVRSLLP